MRLRHPLVVYLGIAGLVVVLDQVGKALALAQLTAGETVEVVPWLLNLTLTRNTGAAFGILSGRQPIFITVSLLVVVAIAIYLWRQRPDSPLVIIALALVTGGAIGNLIDRIGAGVVTDFFDFGFIDFPVFNVADSAIFVGVGLLIVWLLVSPVHTTEPDAATDVGADGEKREDSGNAEDDPARSRTSSA